jgi:hypothetical protein
VSRSSKGAFGIILLWFLVSFAALVTLVLVLQIILSLIAAG